MQNEAPPTFEGTDRYQIERELGQGGMGVVYEVLDRERNTRVALKAITKRDALNIYRLKNEFRQLADLSHPNLVSLHELCFEGGAWFFTMELVQGKSFDEYIVDDSPQSSFPPPAAGDRTARIRIVRDASVTLSQQAFGGSSMPRVTCHVGRLRQTLRQLVEAIAALHEAGKLHRDIKPSNVIVGPDGRVVVLDFGLVSNTTFVDPDSLDAERTVGGCVFGTPAYMSPEQAVGEPVTPASDWYAVGSMVYEAITGQLPFDGSVLEILKQKEDLEPVPPSELVKGVPDDLDQLCRDLLRRDPQKRPSGPEILRRLTGHAHPLPILNAQSTPPPRSSGELFVGRESHLDALREGFDHVREGNPVTIFVHGLSGMGKTALVRCFANDLIRREEAVVLRGRCYERETVPYKAFDNIIDSLSRYLMHLPKDQAAELMPRNIHSLARLFPVLKRVQVVAGARRPKHQTDDAREVRNQAFGALKDLLLRITDFQPLVLNIDDLQWADMDSARLLAFLLSPPEPPPLLLVGAYRRDEAATSPFLRHILGDGGLDQSAIDVRHVALDRLAESESQLLAEQLLKGLPTATALFSESIATESEGVPFFITELVQHVRARAETGSPLGSMDAVSLDGVISARITGMAEPARRLLEVLSVAAGPLEQGIAIEAAGLPPGDRGAMLALRAARLIRTRGTRQTDSAETYHDRVRETVVAHLEPAARQSIHRRLAVAIETWAPGDPERLVDHYAGAGDGVRAGETAIEAAHAAGDQLAFNRAAELYRKAIELRPPDDPRLCELHERYGDALANAGRGAKAAEAYLSAAGMREGAEARRLQRMAAQQYLRSGRADKGIPLAKTLLADLGLKYPESKVRAISSILFDRTALRVRGLDFRQRSEDEIPAKLLERVDTLGSMFQEVTIVEALAGSMLQSRFLRYALEAGEPYRVLRGTAWAAYNASVSGGPSQERFARYALAKLQSLASELDSPRAIATCRMAEAGTDIFLGDYGRVVSLATESERLFREHCSGVDWELHTTNMFKHVGILLTGGFRRVVQEAPAQIRNAHERDDRYGQGFLTYSLPLTHLATDQPDVAIDFLDERRRHLPPGFNNFHIWVMQRTVDAQIYARRGREAFEFLESQWSSFKQTFISRTPFFIMSGHSHRARAAIAAARDSGDLSYLDVAARDAAIIERLKRPDFLAVARMLQAAIAFRSGERARAAALCAEAEALFTRVGMSIYARYQQRNAAIAVAGPSHAQTVDEIDRYLRVDEGLINPGHWVGTYAPGFD